MTLFKKLAASLIVLILTAFVIWFLNFTQETINNPQPEDSALKSVVNACDEITERAASHLVAVVEFQKLEIAGRKARVFKMCMNDHGYIENTSWLKYSIPIAQKIAKTTQISLDEALENLRRANMIVASADINRPLYWALGP